MTYQNVFKFFENMMDRKFEVDKRDIEDKRVPRTMTEFLMEYLQRQFGIQAIAL